MSIRIVVADDQPLVRAGIAMLLAAEPDFEIVAEVGDGAAAVAACAALRPDVAVLDVRMPELDGVEATRRILGDASPPDDPAAVLILTTFDADEALYGALTAGASGFLLKDAAPVELVLAVRAVASGRGWLDPSATRTVIDHFARRPLGAVPADPRIAGLTERELDVLSAMARGRSNAEIAAEMFLSEATVKSHINHLFAKLAVRDRGQAIVFAYQARLVES